MTRRPVAVVGSANLDRVFRVDRCPGPGETVLGATYAEFPGGKGLNQAIAAARMGATVEMVGRVGRDEAGRHLRRTLEDEGVGVSCLAEDLEAPTATACILVDSTGENRIAVSSGANARVSRSEVESALARLDDPIVVCQLEVPLEAVEAALRGRTAVLNPAPAADIPDALLAGLFLVTPNAVEAAMVSGLPVRGPEEAHRAAQWFLDRGVRNVVVTLGPQGCVWRGEEGEGAVRAYPARVVDTTAAGDAFTGALAAFLAEGQSLAEAVPLATVAAGLSTEAPGAAPSIPYRARVEAEFATSARAQVV